LPPIDIRKGEHL